MYERQTVMQEKDDKDLRHFINRHKKVIIGRTEIEIGQPKKIMGYQPEQFELERTNVWSFPNRGKWATHRGDFRGNWPPQLVRNIVLRYSRLGETILDQMCGSGTTLIECKLLGRSAIGVDINPDCVMLTRDRLDFEYNPDDPNFPKTSTRTYVGDARNLNLIKEDTIDLIATHPPYANIIAYSNRKKQVSADLSSIRTLRTYLEGIETIARESYRVLRPGRFCSILVGDTRRHRHHIPIAFKVMQSFLEAGFILREDITKYQWKTRVTREKWQGPSKVAAECWVDIDRKRRRFTDFLLLSYEHLFVFRKPSLNEDLKPYKDSMKWIQEIANE